jgi:hypothetical protein
MFALYWLSYLMDPIFPLHSVWGTTFSIPRFSFGWFENFLQVHSRDDRESKSLLFCLDIIKPLSLMSGLLLSYMLGLTYLLLYVNMFLSFFYFIVFNKKKNGGIRCRIFIFFSSYFSDIVCVFAWYLSSLCINWVCLYMIEGLCLISVKFSCAS